MLPQLGRRVFILLATLAAFGLAVPAAEAATATATCVPKTRVCRVTTLVWTTGNTAIANQLDLIHPFLAIGTDRYTFLANNENTTLGTGASTICTHSTGNGFACNTADFDRISVAFGEQGDTLRINPCTGIACLKQGSFSKPITAAGNGGNDTMAGGQGADSFTGGEGADTLSGGPGNDTLDGGNGGDTLNGGADIDSLVAGGDSGNDTLIGGAGGDGTLDGGGGFDTVSYDDGRTTGVAVSMNGGGADGDDENVINAEQLIGSSAADTLTGGAGSDTIMGRGGDDKIAGGAGNDSLDGETGNDTLDGGTDDDSITGGADSDTVTYAGRATTVDVTLGGVDGNGEGAETDFIDADVENAIGGAGGDALSVTGVATVTGSRLEGRGGADTITGGTHDDTLVGGVGADTLNGGGGVDLASYADHTAGVTANLLTGATNVGDTLANIEDLTGGSGGDALIGNAAVNRLSGGAGNDKVQGGPGKDVLSGGPGFDDVDYSERASSQPVDVSLDSQINDGAANEDDNIGSDFEAIDGGAGADKLSAVAVPSAVLRGNSGNDTMFAPNGGGTLDGGAGNDSLTGGDGSDTIAGGLGDDTIDGLGGQDKVAGGAGGDTIEARDGVADAIDCGADEDTALSDSVDTRKDCETGTIKQPPVVVIVTPQPQPQPQAGPAVTPRIFATVAFNFSVFPTFTKFTSFKVKNVPAGATVLVTCKGPKRKKCVAKRFKKKRAGTISVKPYARKRFPPGTTITVTITKPGTIGLVKLISVRRGKGPSSKTLCLPPGAKKPSTCTS